MLAVDEDRVVSDLRALAEFGKVGTGVNRPAFSDADLAARRWLMSRMQAAGLETVIDGIGNVYGRTPDAVQSIPSAHTATACRTAVGSTARSASYLLSKWLTLRALYMMLSALT